MRSHLFRVLDMPFAAVAITVIMIYGGDIYRCGGGGVLNGGIETFLVNRRTTTCLLPILRAGLNDLSTDCLGRWYVMVCGLYFFSLQKLAKQGSSCW